MLHRKFVIMVTLALTSLAFLAVAVAAGPAQATTRTVRHTMRFTAYKYATAQRGKWYCWGGAGPSCYDCSGLVYAAYRHVHIWLGRTTYDMLHSGRLIRIRHYQVHPGDLAFYGSGHVELVSGPHSTFGAHDAGSRVGWIKTSPYWHPTAYYRVRGALRR